MGRDSAIEWTDHTFNLWWGCAKLDIGCQNCYAEATSARYGFKCWGPRAPRRLFTDKHWKQPLRWDRVAARDGVKAKVFCGSMMDIFEIHQLPKWQNELDKARDRLFTEIIPNTPNLTWMLLTKRPENIELMIPPGWVYEDPGHPPSNVWFGYSAADQGTLDGKAPVMEAFGWFHHPRGIFASLEPLVDPIDLNFWLYDEPGWGDEHDYERGSCPLDWVIVGGESEQRGKYRPCEISWLTEIVETCKNMEVPVFVKQLGTHLAKELGLKNSKGADWAEWPMSLQHLKVREFPFQEEVCTS